MLTQNLQDILNQHNKALNLYIDLLLQWQSKFNLIGNSTIDNIYERHILDSSQVLSYISQQGMKIADLGSGAGLPGIILAILNTNNSYYLVESNTKKVNFLIAVVKELNLQNTYVIHSRIENIDIKKYKFDLITSRALCSLDKLIDYSIYTMGKNINAVFLKGVNYLAEISKLGEIINSTPHSFTIFLPKYKIKICINIHSSITNQDSKILYINTIV